MLVEVRPGPDNQQVGTSLKAGGDGRPDLQIEVNRDLGNGSPEVCDADLGGVPKINPPRFDGGDGMITNALLDLACRFQVLTANEPCTFIDSSGEHKKVHPEASHQFCWLGSGKATFPSGDTIVTVRVRDVAGEYGPQAQIVVRVATPTPTP